jgi:hypothetical protein
VAQDVWFSFVAPASGAVRINSGADFQHIMALWKGTCNNLTNVHCDVNPLRCNGFITIGGLNAGQQYFLQIASQISAAGAAAGTVCMQLLDGNLPPAFTPLTLEIQEQCVDVDMATLKFDLSGGVAPFTYNGNADGETLVSGASYVVIVTDAMGCELSVTGIVDGCTGSACSMSATVTPAAPACANSADGSISAQGVGGTGNYTYSWSNGATTAAITGLAAGTYTVTVTDEVDCAEVISFTLTAPPAVVVALANLVQPSQGQSNGSVSVDVAGGTGQYAYTWSRNGQVVATGAEDLTNAPAGDYVLSVTDANGCTTEFAITLTETVSNQDVAASFFTEVYPNPAKDRTVLRVAFPQARTLYLTLTDATGRVLNTWTERNVTEQNIPVDLKDLPAATYQLRIVTGFETLTEKIVVVR